MASHFPDVVWTLLATAVGERGRDQPGDVDLPHPAGTFAAVQGVLLQERQSVADSLVVGQLDLCGDVDGGHRPQGADALDRGERQVVPGHRGGALARVLGDGRCHLPGVGWGAAVLSGEELHRDLGADPRPLVHGQRVVTGVTLSRGEVLHALGNLEPESADVAAVHPVRGAQ